MYLESSYGTWAMTYTKQTLGMLFNITAEIWMNQNFKGFTLLDEIKVGRWRQYSMYVQKSLSIACGNNC